MIERKRRERESQRPKSDEFAIVDHAVGVKGSVSDEEADDNVDEESNLAGDVE